MNSDHPSIRLLLDMNLGFWGIQVANGLQVANASAIFESLGAEASQLPILWLGAPVMGLLAQPIVGHWSDRTWSRWGRRQPYFLGGAVLGAAMLLALPNSTNLWAAVSFYWVLQLALNIAIAPARPFVGDLLAAEQRTLGYSVQGFCIALGAIAAAVFPWLLEQVLDLGTVGHSDIPRTLELAYYFGAGVILAGTLWTFWRVDEPPPENFASPDHDNDSEPKVQGQTTEADESLWGSLLQAMGAMPDIMGRLAGVQILTWVGIYILFLYLPTAIAVNVLGAGSRQSPDYVHGVEWAGVCIATYNLVCLGTSLCIPTLSRWWGRVNTHALCLMAGCVGFLSLLLIHSRYPLLLSMVGIGIAWAGILSIPYDLLMDELSESESGIYMGLFNGFVTLPQIAMSLGFGWVMRNLLDGNRLWALGLGGLFLGLAAIMMLRLPEPVHPKEQATPVDQPNLASANR
jgi:maltose/moltooligosaccharide transporter